jgi:hypothetical protein
MASLFATDYERGVFEGIAARTTAIYQTKDQEQERQEILQRNPPISDLLRDGGGVAKLFCDVPLVDLNPLIFDPSDVRILESSTASNFSNRIL